MDAIETHLRYEPKKTSKSRIKRLMEGLPRTTGDAEHVRPASGASQAKRPQKPRLAVEDEIGLKDNSPVRLSLRDRQLVIVPVVQPALSLEALLVQITNSNRHAEVLTGPAVGDEAWQRSAH